MLRRAAAAAARAVQGSGARAGQQQRRAMGGHASHGNPDDYVTAYGLTIKKASAGEYALSKAIGATMWFWVFYMGYNQWDLKTTGLPAIFEAEGLDDDDGHGHGHH